MVELRVSVDVQASPEAVFAGLTDWARQGEWMPGTTVKATKGDGSAVGDEIVARTALPGPLGRLGFDDPMRITGWERPKRCEVLHLGRVVRGTGVFEVAPLPSGARYTWIEWVDAPFGKVGEFVLRLGRRPTELALKVALRRFARWVERR